MSNQLIPSNLNILITGENSFIGKNYFQFSSFKNVKEVSLISKRIDELELNGTDVIIHLVAIVHQTKSIPESEYFKVNHDLCVETAKKAKESGVKQFIFLSTIKVYGEFTEDISEWNEDSECFPIDSYGRSKLKAEFDLRKLEDDSFTVSIIRTPLVYGEGVRANMLSIIQLVNKFPLLPFNSVSNIRYFTYIENLVGYIDRIIEKRASGIFIAMDETPMSTTDLVKDIAINLNKRLILFKLPFFFLKIGLKVKPSIFERLYGSFILNNKKTLSVLDFKPKYTTHEGLRKMVESFKKNLTN